MPEALIKQVTLVKMKPQPMARPEAVMWAYAELVRTRPVEQAMRWNLREVVYAVSNQPTH